MSVEPFVPGPQIARERGLSPDLLYAASDRGEFARYYRGAEPATCARPQGGVRMSTDPGVAPVVPPPPRTSWGLTEAELMQGYCRTGCTTPPTVLVEGEAICCACADATMGAA